LSELKNALKRNSESDSELDPDGLIYKITSLIKDGADPKVKNKYKEDCYDLIDFIDDDEIVKDLLELFNNSMFTSRVIAKIGNSKDDLIIEGEKSEILKSVESRIKLPSTISDDFIHYCKVSLGFIVDKEEPSRSPADSRDLLQSASRSSAKSMLGETKENPSTSPLGSNVEGVEPPSKRQRT
jgi:hypothetical protein